MKLRSPCLLLAIFAFMSQYSHADDALTPTTVSVYADGKSVA